MHACRMGYDRIIYVLPTATHRYVSWSSDCNQLKQILRPTCMQVRASSWQP